MTVSFYPQRFENTIIDLSNRHYTIKDVSPLVAMLRTLMVAIVALLRDFALQGSQDIDYVCVLLITWISNISNRLIIILASCRPNSPAVQVAASRTSLTLCAAGLVRVIFDMWDSGIYYCS